MSLKIRLSKEERVLRSVGDQPNGIVGWTAELGTGQGRVMVSGSLNPDGPLAMFGEASVIKAHTDEQPLEVEEAVDALADANAGKHLWNMAVSTVVAVSMEAVPMGNLEQLAGILGDLQELRDALGDRFLDEAE